MTFKPGNVANPAGRPPNERSIAKAIQDIGQGRIKVQGHFMTRQQHAALMLWEAINYGEAHFALKGDGDKQRVMHVGSKDWSELYRFAANHTDGPVRDSASINLAVTVKAYAGFSPDDWDDTPQPPTIDVVAQPPALPAPAPKPAVKRKPAKRKAKAKRRAV